MEPRIQFARTSDGVSIAYYEIGDGHPLVYTPGSITNVQMEWRAPGRRQWYERLAARYRVIRYDRRGTGLSERSITDYSVEALARDIEAVVDDVGLREFALWGHGWSGPAAVACAATHPELVTGLVLYGTDARGSATLEIEDETAEHLLERDWELFTEVWTRKVYEWPDSDQVRAEAARVRESVTQDDMLRFVRARRTWDVTELLSQVRCPTLVLYRPAWANRGSLSKAAESRIRATAQGISGARFVALEGADFPPYLGDTAAMLSAIDEFLDGGRGVSREEAPQAGDARVQLSAGMAVILFADIVESTALTERMGDAAFRERARSLDASLRTIIHVAGGAAIEGKLLGDGVLATFPAASQAIGAALRCGACGEAQGLPLHIGLHAGDVIREANNVFGGAVNIASRISGLSAPGEVLVSETVRSLARTSGGVSFEDRGEQSLKGIGDPVRVWAVREGG